LGKAKRVATPDIVALRIHIGQNQSVDAWSAGKIFDEIDQIAAPAL
jgi:hypothetical protein